MLSKSQFVHMCVCVSVCVCSVFDYHLNVFLPPLPNIGCPKFLEILNIRGKVMARNGLKFENFYSYRVYNCRTKKVFFLANLGFINFARIRRQLVTKNFRDSESLGKSKVKRSGLRFEHFCLEGA